MRCARLRRGFPSPGHVRFRHHPSSFSAGCGNSRASFPLTSAASCATSTPSNRRTLGSPLGTRSTRSVPSRANAFKAVDHVRLTPADVVGIDVRVSSSSRRRCRPRRRLGLRLAFDGSLTGGRALRTVSARSDAALCSFSGPSRSPPVAPSWSFSVGTWVQIPVVFLTLSHGSVRARASIREAPFASSLARRDALRAVGCEVQGPRSCRVRTAGSGGAAGVRHDARRSGREVWSQLVLHSWL